jgi:hypothetical protein
MNTRRIKTLAIVLILLLAGLAALTLSNRQQDSSAGGSLFPELKTQINDVTLVTVVKAGESLTVTKDSGQWVLVDRQNYPVDTGKLRQVLLALADAKKLEAKTSNPEMYEQIGVEDTSADSKGTEIRISGPDSEISLIIGNLAQRKYRYIRIPGEAGSWLIDQNPNLPTDLSGWLSPEILDIDTSRIQSVTITHADGETIRIEKEDSAATDFEVRDIPEGRELSYASVANSIAGVVSKLNLQDVARTAGAAPDDSSVDIVFTTFDGLEISIDTSRREDNTWITVSASQDETAGDFESDNDTDTNTDADEAAKINARLSGWEYQVQSYKADQLRRRWDDILKAEE